MWHHALHHNGSRVNAESRNCVRAYRWNTHCRAGNKSPVLPLFFVWMTFSQSFVPFPFFFLSTFFFSPLSLFLSRLMSCSIDRDIFIDKVAPKLCQRWKVCLFFVEEFLIASLRKLYIYISRQGTKRSWLDSWKMIYWISRGNIERYKSIWFEE